MIHTTENAMSYEGFYTTWPNTTCTRTLCSVGRAFDWARYPRKRFQCIIHLVNTTAEMAAWVDKAIGQHFGGNFVHSEGTGCFQATEKTRLLIWSIGICMADNTNRAAQFGD
jgi:hypothetical protein